MSNITCTPTQAVMVRIGKSKKLYASKRTARRNVAWRILYDTGRLNEGDFNTFFSNPPKARARSESRWRNGHGGLIENRYGSKHK